MRFFKFSPFIRGKNKTNENGPNGKKPTYFETNSIYSNDLKEIEGGAIAHMKMGWVKVKSAFYLNSNLNYLEGWHPKAELD